MRRVAALWNALGLRSRLTLLYGGLFFVAASVLLWFTYLLAAREVTSKLVVTRRRASADIPPAGLSPPLEAGIEARADSVLDEILRNSIIAAVLIGVTALVLGYLIAGRALRPLERVTETAQRLSESTLHERIGLKGPNDEVKRLADTFDAMLDRLHRVFDNQRRFIANASHELRTPLALNRTMLEVSLEEPRASEDLKALARAMLGANARYERLIEGLLLLAQSEQELGVRKSVNVARVVGAVLEQLEERPRSRRIAVHQDLDEAVVEGDPLFLERCAVNLVENAIKHNVRDGHVWVTVHRDGGEAVLSVENTGHPVSPYELDDLFEPFRRLEGTRVGSSRGSGLGLSIVRAIVEAHDGTITAETRLEGGLIITVRLPRTAT